MCSIMGYCGSGVTYRAFMEGFIRTQSRGPDESRIINTGSGILAFHRLSIMVLSPSYPLKDNRAAGHAGGRFPLRY